MSMNYLKNFAEGEVIKASETNANNQFLLEKISDNASDIQSTVNSQIANIKSELATTRTTLQSSVDTKLDNSDSNTIVGWTMPNYSAGQVANFPFTAPKHGVIYFSILQNNTSGTIYVNNKEVAVYSDQSDGTARDNFTILLSKGDVVRSTLAIAHSRFFPMKGAN